ncbi:MAG: DUF2207 domain-containing protein [Lachnospiraceae bacterium]|nr:DUF2207 domain-containing protein [Lachnospiraceae bacterium]
MNKFVLKLKYIIFAVFTLQIFLCGISLANQVDNIDILVEVNNDGSARITQKWDGTFDSGTENYLPITTNDFSISNFEVNMEGKSFVYVPDWNINASFEEKRYKCGIVNRSDGVELCFGISKMGKNEYIFSYDIDSFVKSYNEKDGFNFMFVNPGMSTFPTSIRWVLALADGTKIDSGTAKIWGFGFDGEVAFEDGKAYAYTNTRLPGHRYVVIMMSFEKNILQPMDHVDKNFEDIRSRAFEGSDYEEYQKNYQNNNFIDLIILVIIGVFFITFISIIVTAVSKIKNRLSLKKLYKECDYFKDIPNGGNISLSYILMKDFDLWNIKENNIIGALILKMINDKNLEPIEEKTIGFFGNEKVNTSLKVLTPPTDEVTQELYYMIVNASGGDLILQEKELEQYARVHYQLFIDFIEKVTTKGQSELSIRNGYKKILTKKLKYLTEVGVKELSEVYGLRKYLDEFSLIAEREVKEIEIWDNYMIYATLFGIASKELKDLKNVYPDKIEDVSRYDRDIYISTMYNMALYNSAMRGYRASNAAKMTSRAVGGFGGHTSFGGGGGFSGGGSGGGSR